MIRLLIYAAVVLLATPHASAQRLRVVATFSILGDVAGRVGGDAIELKTLVGPNGDAHVYEATAADARHVANADLILVNGLAFDDWAYRLRKASGSKAIVVVASAGVTSIMDRHGQHPDPHAWQDVRNVLTYVANIERAFAAADPANTGTFASNATAYDAELQALSKDIRAALMRVPPARRQAVTTHGSFAYFELAYDVTFAAPLGTSTEEQASAKSLAALITGIRRQNVEALFLENGADPRLMRQVARETGVKLSGTLYADALSTRDGPAPTYLDLMRHNVRLLTGAMAHGS